MTELEAGISGAGELKAGRELDALVAEKVMGFQVSRVTPDWYGLEVTLFISPTTGLIEFSYDENSCNAIMHANGVDERDGIATSLPAFSEEMEHSWPIAEKLGLSLVCSEDGWYAIKPTDIEWDSGGSIFGNAITLVGGEGQKFAPSETPSLAICIEALRLAESSSFGEPEG